LGNGPSGSLAEGDCGITTPVSPNGPSVAALAVFRVVAIAPAVDNARNARLSMFSSPCALVCRALKKNRYEHLCGQNVRTIAVRRRRVMRFSCGDNFAARHTAQKARGSA
jgi:hypothetical protein